MSLLFTSLHADSWQPLKKVAFSRHGSYKYRTEKQLKEEFEFLKEVDSISLQQTRMNLGVAYQNFFRKLKDDRIPSTEKGFPKFKKKNAKNSFRTI